MCRKLIYLVSFVLVLGLVSYTWAGRDPVAHYEFEGTNDFSNTGTSAAITGKPEGDAQIIWDDEIGSYVLSLDGDGDYVNCRDGWIGLANTAITVVAWIKTDSLLAWDTIVGLGFAWRLCGGQNNNLHFQCSNTTPSGSMATGSVAVNDGRWHHVAGTYDGAKYSLYVDGILDDSMNASGSINSGSSYVGCIGAHYKKSDERDPRRFFDGLIDDVRIYDRALSEAEIRLICCGAPKAYGPSPADCTFHGNTLVNLEWSPGYAAISHHVYFGENFDDVNDGTGDTFQGSQTETFFVVGSPGHPYPDGLVLGTTYYWRIDEVVAGRVTTIYKGDVWSFKIYAIENVEGADFFDDFEDEVIDPFWVILTDNDCPASQVRETIGVLTINVPANLTDYCDTGLKTAMSHSWKRFEASVDFRVPQGNSMAWLTAVVHPDNGRDSGYWCVYYFDQGSSADYYTWLRNNEIYGWERCMRAFGDENTAWHTFKLTYDAETMIANAYVDDIFLNSRTVDLTNFRISISAKAPSGIPASTVEFDNFHCIGLSLR